MFEKMKVRTQLMYGFGLVLICLVAVIVVSTNGFQKTAGSFANLLTNEGGIKVATIKAGAGMLECLSNEKDFMLYKDPEYVEQFSQSAAAFEKMLGETITLAREAGHEDIARAAGKVIIKEQEYVTAFHTLVEAEKRKGLDPVSGLQGALREQAQILQNAMGKHAIDDLRESYLNLRRHEKDYHRTQADRDKTTWDEAIAEYEGLLGKSTGDAESVKAQLEALDLYKKYRARYFKTLEDYGPGLMLDSSYESLNRRPVRDMEEAIASTYVPRSEALILSVRKAEKDYLLRGEDRYVDEVHQGMEALVQALESSQVAQEEVDRLKAAINQYLTVFDELAAEDQNVASLSKAMNDSVNAITPLLRAMDKQVDETIAKVTNDTAAFAGRQGKIGIGVGIFAILAGILAAFLITASIRRPIARTVQFAQAIRDGDLSKRMRLNMDNEVGQLSDALDAMADSIEASQAEIQKNLSELQEVVQNVTQVAHQVTSGANQVADASQSLSQGATEQASSLEEISASMNEIHSQTRTNAENAEQASQLASSARDSGQQGSEQVQALESAMADIERASGDISRIIKTIDDIAFQTNLLALNAAVEAARAGAHGKGFAVVAQEVRALAARSAKAAEETSVLIEGSGAKISHGNDVAQQTVSVLTEIIQDVGKVSDLVDEIAASSNEQAQGISQINQGLTQIDSVTQQNTANAEETAAAAQELSSQAGSLREILDNFVNNRQSADVYEEQPAEALPAPDEPRQAPALTWGD